MSLLKTLETKIEALVEGTFGRLFRSEVRPIELARKLVREMEQHRVPSLSRVYAPHEYELWLSPQDREHYEGIEPEVADELCAYLLEHARREELILAAAPSIRFHTDDSLALGEFGIEAKPPSVEQDGERRGTAAAEEASEGEQQAGDRDWDQPREWDRPAPRERTSARETGSTMIFSGAKRLQAPLQRSARKRDAGALLLVDGRRVVLPAAGGIVGRSRDCEIVLQDSGVSRRHAEIRPDGHGWTITDLGSTNGVRVQGVHIERSGRLRSGDRIELGSTEIVFELR